MAKCRCLATNWKYPLTSGAAAHSRRFLGTTLGHHMGCSQLRWQLGMSTPTEPFCIHRSWVSPKAEAVWLVTTLGRDKLGAHTSSWEWRRGLRAVTHCISQHTPVAQHQQSLMLAHIPFQCAAEGKKLHTGIAAASPGKDASPNEGSNSRRGKFPSPPCKHLLPDCSFPEKFLLAAPQWLLYRGSSCKI